MSDYEREAGPRVTRLDMTSVPPPVEFTVRARVRVWESLGASAFSEIPLFECSRCPGVVVWGDRLHVHRELHSRMDRGPS